MKGHPERVRATMVASVGFLLSLAACGPTPGTGAPPASSQSSAAANAFDPATARPVHNYTSREGALYCYQTAISQDDRNAGQAVSDVLCFKYLGERGGVYRFSPEQTPGAIISCATPCETIKMTVAGEVVKRVTFEPNSVIGSAFEDAINGQLHAGAPKQHEGDDPNA